MCGSPDGAKFANCGSARGFGNFQLQPSLELLKGFRSEVSESRFPLYEDRESRQRVAVSSSSVDRLAAPMMLFKVSKEVPSSLAIHQ
jgi:hypothetical protein